MATVTESYVDVKSCREGLQQSQPDVLLLDIRLPDGNGIDFCGELKKLYPDMKIILLTSFDEYSTIKRALHHGADGYILKNADEKEIIAGIEAVHQGDIYYDSQVEFIMRENRKTEVFFLSKREREVLQLLTENMTVNEIAERLYISPLTVKGHCKALRIKLGARNVQDVVAKSISQQLL
jgi:DNA-binding NarL/FixJ family response regulator